MRGENNSAASKDEMIGRIWNRASILEGVDSTMFRLDSCGAIIARTKYQDYDSGFGWDIEHVFPIEKGGDNNEANLRAMQWQNLKSKGSDFPVYKSAVSFKGFENIEDIRNKRVNTKLVKKLKQIYPLIEL